ncbi:phage tail protein [Pediococcus ethanolidurans]
MAAIGLTTVYTGIKNDDGTTVVDDEKGLSEAGVYEVDANKANGNLGSKTANISGLSGTAAKISGNDEVVDISNPPAAPTVAWDANLINYAVKEKILGRVSDGKGGYTDSSTPVTCGMIVVSKSPITMKRIFWAFGAGVFTEAGQNVQTNTDSAQTRDDDNLTFTALNYDRFENKALYKVYHEDDPDFDEQAMFDTVFPGQTFFKSTASSGTGTDK